MRSAGLGWVGPLLADSVPDFPWSAGILPTPPAVNARLSGTRETARTTTTTKIALEFIATMSAFAEMI